MENNHIQWGINNSGRPITADEYIVLMTALTCRSGDSMGDEEELTGYINRTTLFEKIFNDRYYKLKPEDVELISELRKILNMY